MNRNRLFVAGASALAVWAGCALAAPVVNGSVAEVSEGWTRLRESVNAAPVSGGSTSASDSVAESSTFHWWDGLTLRDVPFFDNRGDVINVYVAFDREYLYLAVGGPTAPFNKFTDQSAKANNDVGDLFIAIDASGGAASGLLKATDGHNTFGVKAVDFLGWTPTQFVGTQYVDNGNGGGGLSNFWTVGATNPVTRSAGQGVTDRGFLWNAAINGAASYDTFNQNAGEFEYRIPWKAFGFAQRPVALTLRLAAYTTQNFAQADVYDTAPGVGQGTVFEELGDCPGDPDGAGQLQACNPGSAFGSTASSNFVANIAGSPGRNDEIDTIEGYLQVLVPQLPCPCDLNVDGFVDDADFVIFAEAYNNLFDPSGDFNFDFFTDDADFVIFAEAYNALLCQ
ncbi:MAG: hypothetical protein K2Y21_10580 [Phycisphaerales bacterium]|nr:hypothetical protein [Phycisphaerales bacterium]